MSQRRALAYSCFPVIARNRDDRGMFIGRLRSRIMAQHGDNC